MRSKYNVDSNVNTRTYDGITFDSEMEMRFYRDFCIPKLEDGSLTQVELQVPYELQSKFRRNGLLVRAIEYVADFVLTYDDGHVQVVDIKGMPDTTAKLKRKLFWYKYPEIDYVWMTYSRIDGGWCEYDTVQKNRRDRKKSKKEKQNG